MEESKKRTFDEIASEVINMEVPVPPVIPAIQQPKADVPPPKPKKPRAPRKPKEPKAEQKVEVPVVEEKKVEPEKVEEPKKKKSKAKERTVEQKVAGLTELKEEILKADRVIGQRLDLLGGPCLAIKGFFACYYDAEKKGGVWYVRDSVPTQEENMSIYYPNAPKWANNVIVLCSGMVFPRFGGSVSRLALYEGFRPSFL